MTSDPKWYRDDYETKEVTKDELEVEVVKAAEEGKEEAEESKEERPWIDPTDDRPSDQGPFVQEQQNQPCKAPYGEVEVEVDTPSKEDEDGSDEESEVHPILKNDPDDLEGSGITAVNPEYIKEAKKPLAANRHVVKELRRRDRSFNHTCGGCGKRLELSEFHKGKKSEVCINCME